MKSILTIRLSMFLLVIMVSSTLFAAEYRYATIAVPNGTQTVARGINAHGDILGSYVDSNAVAHDFLLHDGVFSDIAYPGDGSASARALNAEGDIVGRLNDSAGQHGFLFRDGTITKIDYPGASSTIAFGINNSGDITGQYSTATGNTRSFILKNGVFHKISIPATLTLARGAEDSGRVLVGDAVLHSDSSTHAFRKRNGKVQLIDPPGTVFPCSFGRGINESGDVAGSFAIVNTLDECNNRPPTHGFVLREHRFDIVDPPGSHDTFVYGINDDGVVVGIVTDDNGNVHSFEATPEE